jgi:glucuronide carrier protein
VARSVERLGRLSVVGYGAGDSANSMVIDTATMFLLVYYTDVVGISAAAAGTLLLLVRLFTAFTDIIAGRIVDGSGSRRWGKFRPFLLFGAAPLLLIVAVFHVPDLEPAGRLAYAYLTFAAAGLAYSMVNVPYSALMGAMSQDARERARLASARTVGGLGAGTVLSIFVAPLLGPGADIQAIFSVVTVVFAVVGTGLYLVAAMTAREVVVRSVDKVGFRQSVAALRGNSPLLVLCVSSVLSTTAISTWGTAQLFYLRDVLDRLNYFPLIACGEVMLTLLLAAVMPRLVQVWGKRRMYLYGGTVGIFGGMLVFLAPTSLPWLGLVGIFLSLLSAATVSILVWALIADTVEYGEWATGVRSEGTNLALLTATRRMGMAFGGGLAAFALAWGGYLSGAVHQSESATRGIRAAAGLLPAFLILLAVGVMFWYRLTDERHAELVADIQRDQQRLADVASGRRK